MPDLTTHYMGFQLKNPLIAGSSGLTSRLDSMLELEKKGVAAMVLKSLFEEDLLSPADHPGKSHYPYPKTIENNDLRLKNNRVEDYLRLIGEARKKLSVPVIASINCVSAYEWISFATKVESAGADGLELNMFVLPSDPMKSSEDNEKVYFEILTELRKKVKFPLAVKISPYFSGMTKMALKLSWTGVGGMVFFNRFYQPDIDIDNIRTTTGDIFSSPAEIALPLRWTALLSDRLMSDIAGATGVHDHTGIIKFLLAGAKAVQVSSAFYKKGPEQAGEMLKGLSAWMEEHAILTIPDFCGKLSLKKTENPAAYERFQYLQSLNPE